MHFRTLADATLSCALLIGPALGAGAAPALPGDDLLGLWGGEPMPGPQVRGEIIVERRGRQWTIRVGGFEASMEVALRSASIALPGGQGTLRLWITTDVPKAFWIQPAGMGAVPVQLRAAGANAWRGHVLPVEAKFPLYLMITREPDGALHGVFRNPSRNWPGRGPYFVVARDGDAVTFTDPKTAKLQWSQPYDAAQHTIAFDFGEPVVLTPRSLEQAVGLLPRSPALPAYRYRVPANLEDGWSVSDATTVAMDASVLESLVRQIGSVDPLGAASPRLHSLLVARRGRLVLEEYFRGSAPDAMHDLRSASKTMTSIMVGAAIQHGAEIGSSTTLPGTPITIRHLLSHSSGLACDDDDDASPGNEDTMQAQSTQPDWYAFFRSLPKLHDPGLIYAYCSAGVNTVGQMLGSSTGLWLPRLFDDYLARPMQFSNYGVNLMPSGEAYSGGGMHLIPRDFLKFGQLYLDDGRWHGTRLVSAGWIRESTAHHIDRADGSDDGLGWHRHVLFVGSHGYQSYEASGNGGQFLVVAPDLQLAVVVTAGNYGEYQVWKKIRDEVIPAVMRAAR